MPSNVGNLISSSSFSKPSLYIWKFSVHLLLKPSWKDFEHSLFSMWNECSCMLIRTFFDILIGMNTDLFQSGPLLSFPNLLAYWLQHFHSIIFQDLKYLSGIPSPPLALFLVMLSKAHLTSISRMSGSRWVIIPSWLLRSWRSFLYSFSVYSCYLFLISSASVRSIPFLSFIEPIFAWNVPLISLIFLKRSLVFLLFSSISL